LPLEQLPENSRQRLRLTIGRGTDVPAAEVIAHAVVGSSRRPCLALVAGVHGDEYDGILALQAIAGDVEPSELRGTLLIVPVANPFAFAAGQRRTPEDDTDLNRVFPGNPDGSLSERLADRLVHGLLREADLIFTLHGATSSGILAPWVEFLDVPGPIGETAFAMAQACGIPDLIGLERLSGRLLNAMAELGVPLIEGEVGGRGATRSENVTFYRSCALAVARHAGLLGSSVAAPRVRVERRLWRLGSIAAPADGIFLRDAELRHAAQKGERLGRIVDGQGHVVADIVAAQAGTIGGYREHAGVRRGDTLFNFWLPTTQTAWAAHP
jgi:predicted deacylase